MTGKTAAGFRCADMPSPNTVYCSSPATPGRLMASNPSASASASSTPNSNLNTPRQRTPLSRNSSNGSSGSGGTNKNKSYLKQSQSKTPDSKSARQTVLQAMNAALHPQQNHHGQGHGHGQSSPSSRSSPSPKRQSPKDSNTNDNGNNDNSHSSGGGGGIFRKWGQRRNSILGGGAGPNRRASITGSSPASSTGSHPPPTTSHSHDDEHHNLLLHQNVGWKSLDDSCDTFDLTDDDDLCLTGVKPPSSYILSKDDTTNGDKRDASVATATTIRESFSTITSNSLNGSSNNGNDSSAMGFFIGGSGLSIVNGSGSFVMPSSLDAPVPADQVPQFSASKLITPKRQQQQQQQLKSILPNSAGNNTPGATASTSSTPTPTSAKSTPGGKKSAASTKSTPTTKLSRPPRPSPAPTKRNTEPEAKDNKKKSNNEKKSKVGDVDEGFMEAMNNSTLDMYKSSPAIEYALAAAKDRYTMPFGSPKIPPPQRPKSKSPPARSKSEQTTKCVSSKKNEKNGDVAIEDTTKRRGIGRSKSADDASLFVDTATMKKDKKAATTTKKKPKKTKSLSKQKPSEELTSPEPASTKSKKTKTKKKSKQEPKEVSSGESDGLESETSRPLPKRKPQRQKSSSALATRDQQSPQARKKTPKRSMSAPLKKHAAKPSDNGEINYVPIESLNLTPKTIMSAQEKSPTKSARRPVAPSYVHTDNKSMDDDTSITSRSNSIQSIQAYNNNASISVEVSSETYELTERPIEDEIAVEVEMAQVFASIPDTSKSPSQRNGHSWVASERSKTQSPTRSPSGRSTRSARTTRSVGMPLNDHSTRSTRTTALVDTSSPGRYQRRCRRKAECSRSPSSSMPRRFSASALSSSSSQRPYTEELLATASTRQPVPSGPLRRSSSLSAEYNQRPFVEELLTTTSTKRSTSRGTIRPRLNRSSSHGSIRGESHENDHHDSTIRRGTRRDRKVTRSDGPIRRHHSFTMDRTTNSWADLRQKLSAQHGTGTANESFQGPRRSRLASRARSRSHDLPSSSSHSDSSVSISSVES
mmetsp:Transcript_56332/g.136621  ORF Transcript_56332/g.136621 Transcript_56332/m.136621 type:complete len:1040 (-) Transcript_56332:2762-5881(-)